MIDCSQSSRLPVCVAHIHDQPSSSPFLFSVRLHGNKPDMYSVQHQFNIDILMHLAETRLRNGRLHPGAICDGCFQQIYGVLHKCLVCPDYCLCSECKDKEVHKEHEMIGRHSPHGAKGTYIGMCFLEDSGLILGQGETAWQFYEFKLYLDTSWILHCACISSKYTLNFLQSYVSQIP